MDTGNKGKKTGGGRPRPFGNGRFFFLFILTLFFCPPAGAGEYDSSRSIEVLAGHFWSPVIGAHHRKDLNYMGIYLRPELIRPFRNTVVLGEITYNNVTKGPGNFMAGVTLLVRHYLEKGDKVNPYVQVGAGILYNDIYKDYSQDLIGNVIEFNPQLGLGFVSKLNKNLAFHIELGFQHISNAGIKHERNIGVNGLGILAGLSWGL